MFRLLSVMSCVACVGAILVGNLPWLRPVPQDQRTAASIGVAKSRDDSAELQAAIDRGESICLDRREYHLHRPLEIQLTETGTISFTGNGESTLVMHVAGPAIRIIGTHDGTANPASVDSRVWNNERFPRLSGFEITGTHPEADGILADGTMKLTISEVVIRNVRHGIHLVNRNRNVIIDACHVYDNSGVGVFYDNVNLHQSNIGDSHISYNRGGGIVVRGGDVRNIHIGNCDIEGNMADGGAVTANVLLDSTGGSIGEVAITGCTIQHDHRGTDSANIRVMGQSEPRSFTDELRHGHITICGNVLSDVDYNIDLQQTRGVTVTGNTMWKGYEAAIRIEDCANVVIGQNMFDRNPRYHYGDGDQSRDGVVASQCHGLTFTGNHFGGGATIDALVSLSQCRAVLISGCNFVDFHTRAIRLDDCEDARIDGVLMVSERTRIGDDDWVHVESSERIRVEGEER